VLAVIGALFVLAVAIATLGVWRVETSLDNDKSRLLELAEEFADCLYREDIACLKALSSFDEDTLSRALAQSRLAHARLGARGKSAPIKRSWSMRKFSSLTSSVTTTIRVSLETSYERDAKTREWFEFVEHHGTVRVRNFRVDYGSVSACTKDHGC
jgi:hypothetical protein